MSGGLTQLYCSDFFQGGKPKIGNLGCSFSILAMKTVNNVLERHKQSFSTEIEEKMHIFSNII